MALTTDLRHAVRLLGRSPVFTLTSIVSLALGIGAAATIFSLTDALLFEPTVGVAEPSQLVDIGRANDGSGFDNMSYPTYKNLREHSQTVDVAAVDFGGGPMSLGTDETSERVTLGRDLRGTKVAWRKAGDRPGCRGPRSGSGGGG